MQMLQVMAEMGIEFMNCPRIYISVAYLIFAGWTRKPCACVTSGVRSMSCLDDATPNSCRVYLSWSFDVIKMATRFVAAT